MFKAKNEQSVTSNLWVKIYLVISLAGVLWLFHKFIFPLLISMLLVMICSGISSKLELRLGRYNIFRNSATIISAGLITILLIALVVVPLVTLLSYVINKISYQDLLNLKNQVIVWFSHVNWVNSGIKQKIIVEIQSVMNNSIGQDSFKKSVMAIFASVQKLSSSTFELTLVIVLFFLLLWKRNSITNFLENLNPLPLHLMYQITGEVTATLQIVFCTLLVLAIAQGLAFACLMMFYDYNALVLGFAAGVCSMIPIFGTALVWVPMAINEFATGHVIGAAIIVIFGWLVMAVIIDNFLRIILLKKIANRLKLKQPINEFVLFFSIAGGLSTVGFWGIILGPAVVTLFLTLSHIYVNLKKSQV